MGPLTPVLKETFCAVVPLNSSREVVPVPDVPNIPPVLLKVPATFRVPAPATEPRPNWPALRLKLPPIVNEAVVPLAAEISDIPVEL